MSTADLATQRQAGYHVFAFDAHGHGRSEPLRPNNLLVDDCDHLASDVVYFVSQVVKPAVPGKPVFLSGLSMGGLCVILASIKAPKLC